MNLRNKIAALVLPIVATLGLTACDSDAATVSKNLSTEADQFKVERSIVAINGITDEVLFEIRGLCSITRDGDLVVICREGPNEYKKHMVGLSQNVTFVATQLRSLDADRYQTKVILKPTSIIPDFDLSIGKQ